MFSITSWVSNSLCQDKAVLSFPSLYTSSRFWSKQMKYRSWATVIWGDLLSSHWIDSCSSPADNVKGDFADFRQHAKIAQKEESPKGQTRVTKPSNFSPMSFGSNSSALFFDAVLFVLQRTKGSKRVKWRSNDSDYFWVFGAFFPSNRLVAVGALTLFPKRLRLVNAPRLRHGEHHRFTFAVPNAFRMYTLELIHWHIAYTSDIHVSITFRIKKRNDYNLIVCLNLACQQIVCFCGLFGDLQWDIGTLDIHLAAGWHDIAAEAERILPQLDCLQWIQSVRMTDSTELIAPERGRFQFR